MVTIISVFQRNVALHSEGISAQNCINKGQLLNNHYYLGIIRI